MRYTENFEFDLFELTERMGNIDDFSPIWEQKCELDSPKEFPFNQKECNSKIAEEEVIGDDETEKSLAESLSF